MNHTDVLHLIVILGLLGYLAIIVVVICTVLRRPNGRRRL